MNLGLIVVILGLLVAIPLGVVAVIYLIVPVFKGIAWVVRQAARYAFGTVSDTLRFVGGLITTLVFIPLTVGSIVIGRWSATAHYGRAIQSELRAMGASLYRIGIGHPARLLCLHSLTEGIEQRIPQAIAAAPAGDKPRGRANQFDGYKIVGSLAGGGSGGRLYVAEPSQAKLAAFSRGGAGAVERVVIKSFSLSDGSSLPQIVRESRSLDAAKRLGLILEHELTPERFHYVMRYVPGDSLSLATQRLHAESGSAGLAMRELSQVLEFQGDLLRTLCHYHTGGLWHKDVKPDNIIVSEGQAHLVDFGLVTHLRSAMTLTTHGTEYFRDPEMVRLALKGVKVHEVDGARFDVYAAGAVLYSMIENSFPAHGGLSQITKRCPESLRWVVRRAMTDYDKRYAGAAEMLADVEAIATATDPFSLRLADLPSMRGEDEAAVAGAVGEPRVEAVAGSPVPPGAWGADAARAAGAASPAGAGAGMGAASPFVQAGPAAGAAAAAAAAAAVAGMAGAVGGQGGRARPHLRVTDWWSGRYEPTAGPTPDMAGEARRGGGVVQWGPAAGAAAMNATMAAARAARAQRVAGLTAAEQLQRARVRAHEAQKRAQRRMSGRRMGKYPSGVNGGVAVAAVLFVTVCAVFVGAAFKMSERRVVSFDSGDHRVAVEYGDHRDAEVEALLAEAHADGVAMHATAQVHDVEEAAEEPDVEGKRLLVIRDGLTLAPEIVDEVNSKLSKLVDAGFEVLGSGLKRGGEAAEHVKLAADLRGAVTLTPFNTPEAGDAIRRWLGEHPDLEMVLWLGMDDEGEVLPWLVTRHTLDSGLVRRAANLLAEK